MSLDAPSLPITVNGVNFNIPPAAIRNKMQRKPGTQEPYGLIMETAFLPIFASLPQPTREQEVEWSKAGQRLYAQYGITTAHEGATHASDLALMKRAAAGGDHGRSAVVR